ncbi:MAG TPA: DinB family protein [Puia sp.]|nr:DinB family protein [Puia sp.]
MTTITPLLKELEQEALTTRKMLERVPTAYFNWQPHRKSMTVQQLATHIAELPTWITMAVTSDGLDFAANPYQPEEVHNTAELMDYFEKSLADGRSHLADSAEETLEQRWTLRNGDQVYHVATKGEIIRMAYCQIVHHRAQLGVFLRLLDIPIPGSYGPSADEHEN